jgi:hypothetical protein
MHGLSTAVYEAKLYSTPMHDLDGCVVAERVRGVSCSAVGWFQHSSNTGTAHPNHGIDTVLVLIGVSKFF